MSIPHSSSPDFARPGRRFTFRADMLLLTFLTLGVVGSGCVSQSTPSRQSSPTVPDVGRHFRFTDVQEQAGVRFLHTDGGGGRHYFVEQFCSGCAFLDYDGDGLLDIYAVNGAPLPGTKLPWKPRHQLFRNSGNRTFRDVTDEAGLGSTRFGGGVCVGDFNNDGRPDIYVTNFGHNQLYRNIGGGRFREVAAAAGVAGDDQIHTSAAFLDYDNDGWLDLYVCSYVKYHLGEDRWCGKASTKKSYCGPEVYPSHPDSLYHNNHDGTFTDVTRRSHVINPRSKSLGVLATDINNDGWTDLYVACDLMPNLLFLNQRNGTFREIGVEAGVAYSGDGGAEAGMGVTAGDYDNDAKMDLFVTNYSHEQNALYHNEGNNLFSYQSDRTGIGPPSLLNLGFGAHFADFDNDGRQDVVVANGHVLDDCKTYDEALEYAEPLRLYRNQDGHSFKDASADAGPSFQSKYVGRGLAVGDYDNDGNVDLLVSNNKGPLRLIHNETSTKNSWIGLQLVGVHSNRSAIGARVTVKTSSDTQTQEVTSGSSYLSQSDLRLQFGLGDREHSAEVRVRWPGGKEEVWPGLPAGRYQNLREGAAPPK